MEQQRKQLKRNRSWLKEEDDKLRREVYAKPKQNWYSVAGNAGLNRSGNSCRLRWFNHLKPGYRPGRLTDEEKLLVLEFRSRLGKNCWAKIATHLLPGRRDNDIKNFWHTMAKRASGDVESEAVVRKAELVEKITAAGKFSKDYSSLISANAYSILSTLLPGLAGGAVAGGGAVADFSSTAADTGGADALISAYSADVGPTMQVRHEFPYNPSWDSHIFPDDNVVLMGTAHGPHQNEWGDFFSDYGGGFNQAAAAMWGASNDTGNPHMNSSYAELNGAVNQWGPAARV